MGYLLLSFALFAGLAKGYVGKLTSTKVEYFKDALFVNIIRCFLCGVLGFFVVVFQNGFGAFSLTLTEFIICVFSAIFNSMFCVAWLYAYKNEAYMFLSVFTMLGSIVTGILGLVVYNEPISTYKIIGMVLLVVAVYIMSLYNNAIKGKITLSGLITLIIGGLGTTLADFSQKVYRAETTGVSSKFTFYTYVIAFIVQFLVWLAIKNQGSQKQPSFLKSKKYIVFYVIYSIFLYINLLSKTIASSTIPASQMYPLLQGANLILSAVMAAVLMKERLNTKSIISIIIALVAIFLITM